jgi:hypothetical protein
MDQATFDASPHSLLAFLSEAWRSQRTGTLRVTREAFTQTAYLKEGRVAYASSSIPEEKFEGVLKTMGLVGDKELQLAKEKKEGKESLGKALMRLGFISNQDLYRAAVQQTQIITASLVAQGGQTLFEDGRLPENLADLKIPAEQMLRELTQRMNDRAAVLDALGGESARLVRSPVEPTGVTFSQEERALLNRLTEPQRVDQLTDGMNGFDNARHLYFLLLTHAIEPGGDPGTQATTELPGIAEEATMRMAAPAGFTGAATQRLPASMLGDGDREPTLKEIGKFSTAEVPVMPETTPPAVAAASSGRAPFVAMESLGAATTDPGRNAPAVPTFGMGGAETSGGSPFQPAEKTRSRTGLWVGLLLGLVVVTGAYWFFADGPGRSMISKRLPYPAALHIPLGAKPASAAALVAPASAAIAPRSAPAMNPASTPHAASSAPTLIASVAKPISAPASTPASVPAAHSAPLPGSAPASTPASAPAAAAGDGRALLVKGDYAAAALVFKHKLAASSGYTLQMEVLCKPELSVPKIIATLPADAPYMLVPVNFHGNPACYRELWGIYPSAAAADAGKAAIAPAVKENAGGTGHSATLAQALKENF